MGKLIDMIPEGKSIIMESTDKEMVSNIGDYFIVVALDEAFKVCVFLPTVTGVKNIVKKNDWANIISEGATEKNAPEKTKIILDEYKKFLSNCLTKEKLKLKYPYYVTKEDELNCEAHWLFYEDYMQEVEKRLKLNALPYIKVYKIKDENYLEYISNSPCLIIDKEQSRGLIVPSIDGVKKLFSKEILDKEAIKKENYSIDTIKESLINKLNNKIESVFIQDIDHAYTSEMMAKYEGIFDKKTSDGYGENPFSQRPFSKLIYSRGFHFKDDYLWNYLDKEIEFYVKKEIVKCKLSSDEISVIKKYDSDIKITKDPILSYIDEEKKVAYLFPEIDDIKKEFLRWNISYTAQEYGNAIGWLKHHIEKMEKCKDFEIKKQSEVSNYKTIDSFEEYIKNLEEYFEKDKDIQERVTDMEKIRKLKAYIPNSLPNDYLYSTGNPIVDYKRSIWISQDNETALILPSGSEVYYGLVRKNNKTRHNITEKILPLSSFDTHEQYVNHVMEVIKNEFLPFFTEQNIKRNSRPAKVEYCSYVIKDYNKYFNSLSKYIKEESEESYYREKFKIQTYNILTCIPESEYKNDTKYYALHISCYSGYNYLIPKDKIHAVRDELLSKNENKDFYSILKKSDNIWKSKRLPISLDIEEIDSYDLKKIMG